MFTLAILFLYFQFTLIHGPNILGSCAILFFTALDFTFISSHIHHCTFFSLWLFLFILSEIFLQSSPVAYWALTPTWEVHLLMSYLFAISYCSWSSQGKNTEVVCHSLLLWTMFCQNAPPWPIHFGWPYVALSFIELDEAVLQVISLVNCIWLQFIYALFYAINKYFLKDKLCLQWAT